MILSKRNPIFAACVAGTALLGVTASAPVLAQARHHSWVHRHPTLTGIGAGMATHHVLKVSASKKKARGQRLSWAERHPTLSGIGAAMATHHVIKKTTH